jgi:hypothetical protein
LILALFDLFLDDRGFRGLFLAMSCRFTSILSCRLLSSIYDRLCQFQENNFSFNFEAMIIIVSGAAETIVGLSEDEVKHLSGIIFETVLVPVFRSNNGGAGLRVKREILHSEKSYFREMVKALEERKHWPVFVEESAYVEVCWTKFLTEVEERLQEADTSK